MEQIISDIEKKFLAQAKQQRRKIGIGIWRPKDIDLTTLYEAAKIVDLTVVGSNIDGLNCIPAKDDDEASRVLVGLLKDKKIEGMLRAQLKDSATHKIFLEIFDKKDNEFKNCPGIIAKDGQWIMVTTESNYNGMTLEQKRYEIFQTAKWMENNLGIKPTIGITSTRRPSGRVGEFGLLEDIAQRCETVAKELARAGYDVKEYYIDYEKAIWEGRNMVCPSIGMIGNTWLKGLCYLGGWHLVAVPYLDQGVFYDDTPRNNKEWFWPIISTAAWMNRGKL
jgi:predicted methyltransferase MtxX (methanogen marker protein 4)